MLEAISQMREMQWQTGPVLGEWFRVSLQFVFRVSFGAIAINREGDPNIVILRLAKRAEGPLKCNARFLPGAGAICRCEVPRPAAAGLGMTRLIVSTRRMQHLRPRAARQEPSPI